ncbi:carbohydrate sulfotransferase 11-like [Homarus americanus]|uniref:Carbohydrate sulfotransferase n=1 Tax=Homarus americanus TaxID=6706 RepID=A0A8J5T3L5_HOMAM|nr:carbohydrate sulfotransferase 11-like [Homarus americanus]KAG7172246.1 Carbohydrate sulfotransferase 11-like 6 [Homarus americanus]
MPRPSYARARAKRYPPTKWGKVTLWAFILLAVSTFTIITTSGIDYQRISGLNWILNQDKSQSENVQFQQDYPANMEWEEVQQRRVQHMLHACSSLNLNQTLDYMVLKHLLVDTRHKTLMCFVPKVACTSWKRLWFWMVGLLQDDDDIMDLTRAQVHGPLLPNLANTMFPEAKKEEILRTYKKFLFTRHPLDRLISAFSDKLENSDRESKFDFHKYVGQEVEMMVRGKVTGLGHNVTFPEFIKWVTPPNGTWTEAQKNEHWRPISELCAPCTVQYNAVGRYENLEQEMNATLHWLDVGHYARRFPPPDRTFHAAERRHQYLQHLASDDKLRFLRTYLLDFLLFGYDMP